MNSGTGRVVLRKHGTEATFSELSYAYPLKLLSPRLSRENANAVYVVTYGGGLVGGDRVQLSVIVERGAALVMLTQGSTKVFKSRTGQRPSTHPQGTSSCSVTAQLLDVTIEHGGALFLLPDPVTCFQSATYEQSQVFHLEETASLVLLDWVTSGRKSLGEEWVFSRYYSVNEVWVGEKRLAKDIMLLEEQGFVRSLPPRTLADTLAPYSCYATLIMCGPLVSDTIRALTDTYAGLTVFKHSSPPNLLWSCSAIGDGLGCVVRAAGMETEAVRNWLGEALSSLEGAMGPDIYRRTFG